ncbi:MAG: hypothetical protein K0R46_1704 [Herbinix sp.]|jgi:signal transduction histidine kinase|nr:hypothetical protein [Herbinix sp.]
MDKPFLYFLAKIVAVISSITLLFSAKVDITATVISALSFACVFVLEILLSRFVFKVKVLRITNILSITACFILGIDQLYPLLIVLLIHLLDLTLDTKMFYYILIVILLLTYFIFPPTTITFVITFILVAMLLFSRWIIGKLVAVTENQEHQKELVAELGKKLTDMRGLTKTLKYNASVEERNRIAARIHDQVGHGISGSIIMLEAALLIMKDNPPKASESVQKAVTNLRDGVDEIRMALRDERVERYLIGLNEINAILEEFKVSYNKGAKMTTSGNLDTINIEIWACIHDNTQECLTNLLKHSNATDFNLSIDVFKKLIKVEYKDNGSCVDSFEKGLGLEAIEERTVHAKGKCFFNKGEHGFSITNIFTC